MAAEAFLSWEDSAETEILLRRVMARRQHTGALDSMALPYYLSMRGHAREAISFETQDHFFLDQLELLNAIPPTISDTGYDRRDTCPKCDLTLFGMRGDTLGLRRIIPTIDSIKPTERAGHHALVDGYTALARHDTIGALRILLTISDSGCHHSCVWVKLTQAQLLESRRQYADAAKILENVDYAFETDIVHTLLQFERGRLAERMSDKARARDAYTFVAHVWQNCDSVFRDYAIRAREGLARVNSENGAVSIPLGAKTVPTH